MPDEAWPVHPRMRVITDNDYGGDPDGLVQLAHILLSASVEVRAVIGSHLRPGDPLDQSSTTAADAAAAAERVVELCGRSGDVIVTAGSDTPMVDGKTPVAGPAVEAIIAEAMRDDTDLPLYVTCGGGLTEMASAWLVEPRIAARLTLIWIGGAEHEGHGERPPGGTQLEYNTAIDAVAAQVVFNDSDLRIWQVPRNVYRTTLASRAEMRARMAPCGPLGRHLFDSLAQVADSAVRHGLHLGEAYILGDSPLVLLSGLQSSFEPDASSSSYVTRPCPRIVDSGGYVHRPDGRPLRIYNAVDNRLLLEDLWAKLALLAQSTQGEAP
jgi:inosine-uridine nucleoside N-ribohydrolase